MDKKTKNKKFRWGKFFLWFFLVLLLLIVGIGNYLAFNAEKLINNNLASFVYEKTNQTYRFNFDSFKINFPEKEIIVSDVSLKPDALATRDSTKKLYEFKTRSLVISRIELIPLLWNKRFDAELFKVERPELKFSTGENVDLDQLSKKQVKQGDTLNIPFFSEIFFDTLLIVDAQVNIDTLFESPHETPKINLEANHFKLGGLKYTDSPFPFDVSDISLKIENIKEDLPDSIHQITVKQINVSLFNSEIKAKGVSLSPISDTISTDNLFYIEMPEILLTTNQIDQLHQSDTIAIKKMVATSPSIQIKFGTKVMKGTPLNEINFYKLIEKKLKWVTIDHFSITNADVKLVPANSNKVAEHFENLFINFYNFKADSTSYKDADRILAAKDFNISLKRFTLYHSDEVHKLTVDDLKISTRENRVNMGSIEFKPINSTVQNKVNTIINIKSDGLAFKDVDFYEMYHRQKVYMKELIIKSPVTEIGFHRRYLNKNRAKDKSIILEKTKDYIQGIYVDKTTIENGRLRYNYMNNKNESGFFSTHFNFELSQLSVDSVTFYQSDKIFFAQNFNLNFSDINLQLADDIHRMLVDSLNLSSEGHSAEIFNLKVVPLHQKLLNDSIKAAKQSEIFDIYFPRVKLSGANLHHAFFNKQLYINNFTIYNPEFNIEKYGKWASEQPTNQSYQNEIYVLISDYMRKVSIRNLNMDNGTLNLTQHKAGEPDFKLSNLFSIKMKNFEIDRKSSTRKDKLFFSDNIDLVLKNHSFTLADGVHKVDAKEIGILSSQKRVYIIDAKLYPDILCEAFKKLPLSVFAEIPEMQVTNADIFGLLNNGELPVNTVNITRPNIRLLFQKTEKNGKNDTVQKPVLLLQDLKSITANKIVIDHGNLELSNYENFTKKPFLNTEVDFTMNHFKITQNSGNFTSKYANFAVDLNNLKIELPDQVHSFTIDNAKYAQNDKHLAFKNISIFPQQHISQNEKRQFINLKIPLVELSNFNFEEYLDTKNITSNSLFINNPVLSINDRRIEKKGGFSPYEMDLYPIIKPFAKSIVIDQIQLKDANLDLENDKPIHFKNLNIQSGNFVIDQPNTNKGQLFNMGSVDIELKNINGKTKDGNFTYKLNDIKLNDKGTFSLSGISLTPVHSWEKYAQLKKYQDDYFNIDNVDITGKGLNVRRFIENKDLLISSLNANFEQVSIKRDKTYPLPPNHWPKMPQQALRELNQNLNIEQAHLNIGKFEYTELEPGAIQESYVFVTGASATLLNITNIDKVLNVHPNLRAKIEGNLMGKGKTNIEMNMNVRSFGNEFTFNAICEEMPLSLLNPLTEPGLHLSIKEGWNKKMEVYFEANGDSALGDMRFAYNDLKISVLNTKDGEVKEGKFVSFLVNSIALKSDNPKPGRILLPAKFKNHRDKSRSVVGYCWRSIYAGIKSTLGLKEKEESK